MPLSVQTTIGGVDSVDEDQLERLTEQLEKLGAEGVAVVFWPEDREITMMFDIEEGTLGRVLQPEGSRAAA